MPRKSSSAPAVDKDRSPLSRKRSQPSLAQSASPLVGEGRGGRGEGLQRNVCFVTGTRADFGLMQSTLRAIQSHPALNLQLIATGMHLDPAHGRTLNQLRADGWRIDATIPWKPAKNDLTALAQQTGQATARLAATFEQLKTDIVLVVGDRVEAFAAATAAHLAGRVLAHVHGGDRAMGQVDDALRHAITKLAHLHFPATKQSAQRIAKLGEDKARIHQVGSPGLDNITTDAWPFEQCLDALRDQTPLWELATGRIPHSKPLCKHRYALLLLHPTDADDQAEHARADLLFHATLSVPVDHVLTIYPNNDPGSVGIVQCWEGLQHRRYRMLPQQLFRRLFVKNLPRPAFLALLRDAACLVGNSSSGIIEAASFGTPVVDIGPRQAGRERGHNVTTVPFNKTAIRRALAKIWNNGHPLRYRPHNLYGAGRTASRITQILARTPLTPALRRKLINY